jgi:hypothetical protein
MVVFKLRTKIEVLIALLMMIVVATITAVSVTRTITDTGDSVETFIRNSNGNYWSVSEANIQAAINDLSASGWKNGIVWIPGDKEIIVNNGIVLKKYVTLDLQGSYLDVRSNVDGVTMAEGSVLRGGTIDTRNYAGTYTKAAVAFNPATVGHDYWTGNTRVQNMFLLGALNEGSGIQYQLAATGDIAFATTCSDIYIHQFKYGILINVAGGSESTMTYANGNLFNNIFMIYPQYAIYIDRNTAVSHNHCDCDGNQFDNVQIQTGSNTMRAIYAEGRYNNFDNIFVWDWSGSGQQYAFEFPSDSQYQFLTYHIDASTGVESNNRYISNGTSNYRQDLRNGEYAMKTFSQASEPDIPTNTMAYWIDTDAGPKYYIIQDFGGVQKKAELI